MKPASAKNKGRLFQKWVVKQLLSLFSRLENDDIRSTSMGASGEDILLSAAARRLVPYSIECKSHNSIAVYKWLEQRSGSDYPPLVFAKGNHKDPIVIMYAEEFFKLIKEKDETKKD